MARNKKLQEILDNTSQEVKLRVSLYAILLTFFKEEGIYVTDKQISKLLKQITDD